MEARGRRDSDGYAAAAHRGLVSWQGAFYSHHIFDSAFHSFVVFKPFTDQRLRTRRILTSVKPYKSKPVRSPWIRLRPFSIGWPFQRGVYNPAAAPLAGITGGGYTPSGARKRESTQASAAAELHAAVFGAGLPLPPPPLKVGLRAAAKALPPDDPRHPRTEAEVAYAKFLKGIMEQQPPPTTTTNESSSDSTAAASGASPDGGPRSPKLGAGDEGRFVSTLKNVIMPSLSMKQLRVDMKKDLLHDPDLTKQLYDNEKGGRLAGGGNRLMLLEQAQNASSSSSATIQEETNGHGANGNGGDGIRTATGEEIFSPRATVVIDPVGRMGGGEEREKEEVGRGKVARRRQQHKIDNSGNLQMSSSVGKANDADESASTATTANKVGKIHFDAKAGRGDAGGDKDFVSEHSAGVAVAVCRFVDHKRVPYSCRDDLVTHATLTCMDLNLNCVRWSSDTILLWGSCNDPDIDDAQETRQLTRNMLDATLELRQFVHTYHEGRKKAGPVVFSRDNTFPLDLRLDRGKRVLLQSILVGER